MPQRLLSGWLQVIDEYSVRGLQDVLVDQLLGLLRLWH